MFKKKFYLIITILVISLPSFTNSYNDELDFLGTWLTIKELKENIDYLDKTNSELDDELKNLNTDYELKNYLRKDLSLIEIYNLKVIISSYNRNKLQLDTILIEKAKNLQSVNDDKKTLLELKKEFYNSLIPFIDNKFNDNYINYIKKDAKIFTEQNDISTDIIVKKEILINKVSKIEIKIQEQKDFINKKIKNIIDVTIDEKITNLSNNVSFNNLSKDSKLKVLEKTIYKIKEKLDKLIEENLELTKTGSLSKNNNDLINKKIQTYIIALDKLVMFKDSIK